ncbi:hypothetical protein WOSG25_020330 [Weissella oryzae SG25]|uniref:MmcQ/YjbR family DNA-binding protein n=1 Tax=Weissella oryzae (strain DSM 25784 / JCM 18191 / LMG 30913 / SG25) TaxID=1329250 RepID=A0A069CSM3_WEIOS|nr:MmcQ/YjbR family DNA-binding protein [Weissella oryzae]GAK30238.1 hypothetical protein WOSG25_020330 [Weissella oryzae SG25]
MSSDELMILVEDTIKAKLVYPFNAGNMHSKIIYHVYENERNDKMIAMVYEVKNKVYINLKLTPEHVDQVVEIAGVSRGFHMSKRHWVTIDINNTDVSQAELVKMLHESERLIANF